MTSYFPRPDTRVHRVLEVVDLLTETDGDAISAYTGIPRKAVSRALHQLVDKGLVRQLDPHRTWARCRQVRTRYPGVTTAGRLARFRIARAFEGVTQTGYPGPVGG